MAQHSEIVRLVDPVSIERNPENPRLIFREDELEALQESIAQQGILVPLTIYETSTHYVILDGERRWRCALKLGLTAVPAIVQPEPDSLTNIMMMFAIHKTRSDWDPLPTAMKLQKLEEELTSRLGYVPTESELAASASLSRGEVRRYRNILRLPEKHKDTLLSELEKPRPLQVLTVDHVLESVRGAEALGRQEILGPAEQLALSDALVEKFKEKTLSSTVEPRKLPRIARAVQRAEIPAEVARNVSLRLINEPLYTVNDAFRDSVERVDFEHATEQLIERLQVRLLDHDSRGYTVGEGLANSLEALAKIVSRTLSRAGR
jgi:ParB family transcriptional regulator, chromosome partitioning protein